ADRNRSHWSTSKTPSYTKSVSWQHHRAFLLNSAQAQNSYKDPSYNDDFGIETPSALDNFTQAIQSQILGGLLSNINTGKPGRMVTNDYIVDIANRDGQLQLNVTDRKTGQTSTIQVSGLQNNSTDF
uniref:curli production assembly/transport protein CsgF n=1 Tax=Escherichia coli TaxID=562 RepID=UPI00201F907F